MRSVVVAAVALVAALVTLTACGTAGSVAGTTGSTTGPAPRETRAAAPAGQAAPTPGPTPRAGERVVPEGPRPADGAARAATLTVEQIGMQAMAVRPYRGTTDDAAGTAIQDGGVLASPSGPGGGVGPGGVGNYLVTGHRLSSSQAFLDLPVLDRGDRVTVEAGDRAFVYEIRRTRITSFRDPDSLAAQRAAVPGRPGVRPTRAMITLSTCRTPEDRAEGNDWSDEFGNPENRIDKIGVLVASRPV